MSTEELSTRFVSRLTNETIAVILAGGRGSRLKMMTDWRSKPAIPFGGKFRIIDFPLSNCLNSGVRKICVLTQYKSHLLVRHIMRGWNKLNVEMGDFIEVIPAQQWVEEHAWFEGTADAVYQSLDIIRSHVPEFVLVLGGDHVYQMDYGEMLASHVNNDADITVSCIPINVNDAKNFGVMGINDNFQIKNFEEKPDKPRSIPNDSNHALASMGVYIFSIDYLEEHLQRDSELQDSQHDFGKDIIPYAVKNSHRIFAYPFSDQISRKNAYWKDVGTIDAYYNANMEVLTHPPTFNLHSPNWRIFTYQEQLPPAKFVGSDESEFGTEKDTMVSGGCIVHQSNLAKSLLFSNVKIEKHCDLSGVLVLPGCVIGENSRLKNVVVDNGSNIPAGTIIGEDLDKDAKKYHVTPNGVVFVNREMLGQGHRFLPHTASQIHRIHPK